MNTRPEESALHERAPAKVNLFLHVAGRRDDGFHDLESLVVFTAFGDEVSISPSSALTLERSGPFAGDLPDNPEDDLCLRAATKLAKAFGRAPTAHIVLVKNIPVASGVGGGSSDAAAVLRGLCRLWGLDVRDPRVIGIAEDLGGGRACLSERRSCLHFGYRRRCRPACTGSGVSHVAGQSERGVGHGRGVWGVCGWNRGHRWAR